MMMRVWMLVGVALVVAGCGGRPSSNTTAGNETGSAQSPLSGVGSGPAPGGSGGVQNPGNTSGDNPQGEVSPSGAGGGNSSG